LTDLINTYTRYDVINVRLAPPGTVHALIRSNLLSNNPEKRTSHV